MLWNRAQIRDLLFRSVSPFLARFLSLLSFIASLAHFTHFPRVCNTHTHTDGTAVYRCWPWAWGSVCSCLWSVSQPYEELTTHTHVLPSLSLPFSCSLSLPFFFTRCPILPCSVLILLFPLFLSPFHGLLCLCVCGLALFGAKGETVRESTLIEVRDRKGKCYWRNRIGRGYSNVSCPGTPALANWVGM